MDWYNGSVEMAINKALSEKKMFIVYIEGEDTESTKMTESWNSKMVCDVCCARSCVSIKIKAGSTEAEQFSKCYPVLCIPSTYMINQSGIPVDIIAGFMQPDVFAKRLKNSLELPKGGDAGIKSSNNAAETDDSKAISNEMPQGDSASNATQAAEEPDTLAVRDKVEHAKMLIEKQRMKKEKEERQEQIEKEKKRRLEGRDIATAKKQQKEREAKQMIKDQEMEKAEAKAAKEAIRQKILQDKAEKAAKFEAQKNELKKRHTKPQEIKQETPNSERPTSRIQFRLPDGSAITNEYQSTSTLGEIAQSLMTQINWQHGSIRLATVYPKKEFTSQDMESSIRELNLVPSAVLIVLPPKQQQLNASNSTTNSLIDFIKYILAPVISLLMYLKVLVFGSENSSQHSNGSDASSTNKQQQNQSYKSERNQSAYKREGNVYKFKQEDDDDKDDKTWNGNSTQQM